MVLNKGIAALLGNPAASCQQYRIVLRGKRELIDHNKRQSIAFNVDSFPKAHAAHKNGARLSFSKALNKFCAAVFALHEHLVGAVIGGNKPLSSAAAWRMAR